MRATASLCTLFAAAALAACHHARPSAPAPAVSNKAAVAADATCDVAAQNYARLRIGDHANDDPDRWRPRLAALVGKACTDTAWSAEARNCYANQTSLPTEPDGYDRREDYDESPPPDDEGDEGQDTGVGDDCARHLTDDQGDALAQATTALDNEIYPPPPPPDPKQLAADIAAFEARMQKSATGIAECDGYMHSLVVALQCEKMPDSAKQALMQGGDAMAQAFSQIGQMPPDTRNAMRDGCKAGLDAMNQTIQAMGCTP